MGVVTRLLVMTPFLFILFLVMWVAGIIVPPYAEFVMTADGVLAVGFDAGAGIILKVGLVFVPALLAVVVMGWAVFGELRLDLGPR